MTCNSASVNFTTVVSSKVRSNTAGRRGAMLPLVGVVMIILFIAAAFSIDIARMHVTRSELRTATDAAARAACEALGREQSQPAAVQAALDVAQQNIVAGRGLTLDANNIRFGGAVPNADGSFSFDENASFINSARVIGTRTAASPDGAVGLFFGHMLGQGTFEPSQAATATRTDRDIAMVLDVSGSMNQNGRFAALQNGVSVFLAELVATRQKEFVSLAVYSTQARKLQDMTSDMDLIRNAFAGESPGGFTGIGRGLRVGLDSILNDPESRPFALKSIVLMTDGNQNRGVDPTIIARECARDNVTVHTITFSRGANQTLMKDVARIGRGIHLHADTNDQLVTAFRDIARQLQVLLIE